MVQIHRHDDTLKHLVDFERVVHDAGHVAEVSRGVLIDAIRLDRFGGLEVFRVESALA